jgi:hypothetical protein
MAAQVCFIDHITTPAANRQRNKFPGTIEAGQRRRYHPL